MESFHLASLKGRILKRLGQGARGKRRGSAALIVVLTLAVVSSMIAISTAKAMQASQASFMSSRIATQAQQYAVAKMDELSNTSYSALAAQAKTKIANTDDYYDKVTLGSESSSDNINSRLVTVDVYKGSSSEPRYTLKRTFSSADGEEDAEECLKAVNGYVKLASGIIFQWGKLTYTEEDTGKCTFPTAFPTACVNVQTTYGGTSKKPDQIYVLSPVDFTKTGFQMYVNDSENNFPMYWFAVGY